MQYGYFDNENKEYVITRPDTPTPWMNYIGEGGFGGIVSATGGGLAFDGDPSNRRVTKYRFDSLPMDRPGRYIYIRDMDSGEYWSPTWQPVLKELECYECRHGLGYTVIAGQYSGIETTVRYYVPPGAGYEVWKVSILNKSGRKRNLRLFSYVEFSWNDAKYDMLCHWPSMALMADYSDNKIVVDTVAEHLTGTPMYSYIATDFKVSGYDCSRKEFIGSYRSESNPVVLEKGECKNSVMHSDCAVGVLASDISLDISETANGNYTLGAARNKADIDIQINEAFNSEKQTADFNKLKQNWQDYLNIQSVKTPDENVNTMLNIWHAYQAKTTFDWSRFISVYERGVDRGFGFRDSMQDVLGVIYSIPEKVKERIKLLLSIQYQNGSARTVYYPATGQSVGGGRSDDHLWPVLSVCNYIKESGDTAFLDETVTFVDGGEAPVWQHLEKGLDYCKNNLGPHGIPDIMRNDWNDSLHSINKGDKGTAESVFVFFQLAHAAYELTALYQFTGKTDRLEAIEEIYDYCKQKSDTVWDGEWFIRAFTQTGEKYGTYEDEYNRIYLNPQSWAVLSRLPDAQKANTAFDRVMEMLYTDNGLLAHYPASSGYDPDNKSYYLFTAGARENGGIFFHSNTWAIIALCMLGRNEDAWKCYKSSLPAARNDRAEIHLTEPYIYSQTMLAPPHDRAGACVNSWLTGTASWMYYAVTQYILGIRPEYEGLKIDPCIPAEWNEFSVKRVIRGITVNITVQKSNTKKGLFIGGKAVEGNTIAWSLLGENSKDGSVTIELYL